MRKLLPSLLAACAMALTSSTPTLHASIAYGDLNNFDTVNDTGVPCHGFEIELDDLHSTDITYTYDWNHYGVPKISEDNSNPLHPKVVVRYSSSKNTDGTWAAYTAVPLGPTTPTDGHMCTDPSVNQGCEHFGVGYAGSPTAVRYHWLIDDGTGTLVQGPAVNIATPIFNYLPPDPANNAPAVVQAAIVPPKPAELPLREFGEATWVKEIRTTSHNNQPIELKDLRSIDPDHPEAKDWRNGEPDEIEVEWQLLQTEFKKADGGANGELAAAPQELANNDEIVTRRYEFFKYTGPLDPESGEALCDNVAADGIHGVGIKTVNGIEYDFSTIEIVGEYIGAQMAAFAQAAPLGLIDNLQDGDLNTPYVARTIIVGGNTPYIANISSGTLPPGMEFDGVTGILSGTPTAAGTFQFNLEAQDSDNSLIARTYSLKIVEPVVIQPAPTISALAVESITQTTATLGWTTDQPATSQVEVNGILTPLDSTLVTQHQVTLTDLTPATTYHISVISANAIGGSSATPLASITTLLPPPLISGVAATTITQTSATISWSTDQPATSQLEVNGILSPLDSTLLTQHQITLANLTPATTYTIKIISANSEGSTSVNASLTLTTATPPPATVTGSGYITKIGPGYIRVGKTMVYFNHDTVFTTEHRLRTFHIGIKVRYSGTPMPNGSVIAQKITLLR